MPQIEKELMTELTKAIKSAAKEADRLGLLKSDPVEFTGTPTLEQLIELGIRDEIANPDFYNAINEAKEKNSVEPLKPLLAGMSVPIGLNGETLIDQVQAIAGSVLNNGKPIADPKQLTRLTKADMQAVLDSDLLPVRVRQTLQALMDLSGQDGLDIVRNSKSEGFRRLADLYSEQIGNRAPVEVVFNLALNPGKLAQGLWNPGDNRVHISPFLTREQGLMEATILHETMHPIWDRKITDFLNGRTDRLNAKELEALGELQQLFTVAQTEALSRPELSERDLAGTKDLREFLNEALNHKPFQDFLNSIQDPDAKGKDSLWRRVLNAILKLIRGGDVAMDSVLQRAFELSVDLASGKPATAEAVQAFESLMPETRAEADLRAAEELSDAELDEYNFQRQMEASGQSVLASSAVLAGSQENIPGSRSGVLSGLANADFPVKLDYHNEVNQALMDPGTGRDTIAEILGISDPIISATGPSIYSPSPGVVEINPADILTGFASVEDATRYMLLRGAFTNQNAVAGLNPQPQGDKDAAVFDIRRVPTESEVRSIFAAFQKPDDTAIFLNEFGLAVVKLGFDDSHTPQVWAQTNSQIQALLGVNATPFKTNTVYHENEYDDTTDPTADEYGLKFQTAAAGLRLGGTSASRPLDLQAGSAVRLRQRLAQVDSRFASEGYGSPTGKPSQLLGNLFPSVRFSPPVQNTPIEQIAPEIAVVEALTGQPPTQDEINRIAESARVGIGPSIQETAPGALSSEPLASRAVGPEQDANYFAAVNAGDMETAQRMVDEAANAAGYTESGWHGTSADPFEVFRTNNTPTTGWRGLGAYFSRGSDEQAAMFGDPQKYFLKLSNTFETTISELMDQYDDPVEARAALEAQGYDSLDTDPYAGAIAVFSPEQIKSADPVTRDNAGNVIPLSERFQPASPDIRFSQKVGPDQYLNDLDEVMDFPTPDDYFRNTSELTKYIDKKYVPVAEALKSWVNDDMQSYEALYQVRGGRHGDHYIEYNPYTMTRNTRRQVDAIMREELIHAASGLVLQRKGIEWVEFYEDLGNSLSEGQRSRLKTVYRSTRDNKDVGSEYFRAGIQQLLYGTITESEMKETPMKKILALLMDFIGYFRSGKIDPIVKDVYEDTVRILRRADKKNADQTKPLYSELVSASETLGKLWQEAAAKEGGDAFAYGDVSPEVKSFPDVLKAVLGGDSKNFPAGYYSDGNDVTADEWDKTTAESKPAEIWVKDTDGGVTVFFSEVLSGKAGIFAVNSAGTKTKGSGLYQAFYAWAHNNGKIVGPDSSLSKIGQLRRTSQMLSSALRFGTTQHMRPSPEQKIVSEWRFVEVDENGRPWEISRDVIDALQDDSDDLEFNQQIGLPIFTKNGDEATYDWDGLEIKARVISMDEAKQAWAQNIGLLAAKESQLVFERIPELNGLSISKDGYLFGPDEEYPGSTRALPAGNTKEYLRTLKEAIRRSDPEFAGRIGPATLGRALATRFSEANFANPTLLSSDAEGSSPSGQLQLNTFSPYKEALYSEPVDENLGTPEGRATDAIDAAASSYASKSRFLTPEERGKQRSNTRKTFVEIFNSLPSEKEFAAAAIGGQAKRGWYRKSTQAIIEVFGGDSPRFAALLAATSPQTSVENNLVNALNIWKNWTAAGRPTDRQTILRVMGDSVMGNKGEDSVLDAWVNNSVRALTSADPEKLVISGPKVNSFMLNLRGVVNEVTNDAWMANFALVDQVMFKGSLNKAGTDPGKGPGYLAMSARVRAAAKYLTKITGEEWTPAEVQETVWSWAKTLYELQERQGESRTALEILQAGDLTDDAIANTPDFATLLNNGTYRQILLEAGYGDALGRLAQSNSGAVGETQQRFDPEAGSALGKTLRTLQERSARRLTRLYQQRQEESARKAAESANSQLPTEPAALASRPVPFSGSLTPGLNPTVYTQADRRQTEALARVRTEPAYRGVQAALGSKSYFKYTEAETLAKANEFIDANNGDLAKAFYAAPSAHGLTNEQTILARGLALKKATAAANAARAGKADPNATPQEKVNFEFVEQYYSDLADDFAEELMETASLAGQELRAFRLLADTLAPRTWSKIYKNAATNAQRRKFQGGKGVTKVLQPADPVLKEMMDRIKEARRIAANSTTQRMLDALAIAAKKFVPEGTSNSEVEAYDKFARLMASNLSVRDDVMQAAVEQTVVSGVETIRRSVAPDEQVPEAFLREWENRLRDIATEQINAIIESRLQGGKIDAEIPPELSEDEKKALREEKIKDAWRELSDVPLGEIVFNLARSTIVASDSPYAGLVRKAQFDPTRVKAIQDAVKMSIDTAAEIRKSVADRRMSVESLKLRLAEANPNLNADQLGRLATAVEAVYNEEVARATQSALATTINNHAKKGTAKKLAKDKNLVSQLLPLVNMGAFSDEAAYNAISESLGLPSWNPATAREIEVEAEALQALPEGSIARQEAGQQLMSNILKANIKEARGMQKFGHLMQIGSALWSAGILSAPPTQIVNSSMSAVSVFLESAMDATGYYVAATASGASQAQSREFFIDMARAWVFAFGKDGNNTSLRAINEAYAGLTRGTSKFKSEKLENMSPLEMFKFDPRVAIPGNAMMDAIVSGEIKKAGKEAMKMAAGVPWVMADRIVKRDVKGAVKDYAATMKLVGRMMLAADAMNQYGAATTKQFMIRRYLALQEGMGEPQIDSMMREIVKGGEESIRDKALTQAEDEAQRGDFGPTGTNSHDVQKARRIEQLIEQQTFDTDTIDKGRDFAAVATFNSDPYGVVGWLMDTLFAGPTRVLGLATKPINPFPKTMSNLINAAINYSPYGSLRAEGLNLGTFAANLPKYPQDFYRPAPERGTPEYYALHARSLAGTAGMGLITLMLASAIKERRERKTVPWFEIHGPGPSDPKSRKQWREGGARAFSVRIGELVINYTDWPGANLALGVIGTLYDQVVFSDQEMDLPDWMTQTLRAVILTTLNRNALGGTSAIFEIMAESSSDAVAKSRFQQISSSYASGITRPSFVRWVETIATGTRQETKTTEGWLLSMTPVVSAFRGRPALNILGEPVEITPWDATAGRIATTQKTHPILTPLTDAQLWINPPQRYARYDPSKSTMVRKMTEAEFYDYSKFYGEALQKLLTEKQAIGLAKTAETAPNAAQEALNNLTQMAVIMAQSKMAGKGYVKGRETKGP
jgi:hypothetical protein